MANLEIRLNSCKVTSASQLQRELAGSVQALAVIPDQSRGAFSWGLKERLFTQRELRDG